jgi:predicted MFS family arabinose efflux permease
VDVLKGDVTTNGLLLSARGVGSLVGALMIAAIGSRGARGKIWMIGYLTSPVFLMIFAAIRWIPASLFVLMLAGWGLMAMINTPTRSFKAMFPINYAVGLWGYTRWSLWAARQ